MLKIDGEKIKKLRESQGLTQLYMATAVEVTTDTISRWENKRYPTIKEENGIKLAETLGVPLEEILLEEEISDEAEHLPPEIPLQKNSRERFSPLLLFILLLAAAGAMAAGYFMFSPSSPPVTIKAVRIMPHNTIPNTPFPVVIEITHNSEKPLSVILKENLPQGATILKTSPQAGTASPQGEIKWLKKISAAARFSYLIKVEGEMGGIEGFSGSVSTASGDDSVQVQGKDEIRLGPFHWADSDGNNQISDQEILTVFDYYSGIDDFTIDIAFIEKMWLGSSYSWDREKNLISISP